MKIEHIAMYVNNLEKSKDFFKKYFGAVEGSLYENKAKGFSSYFLSFSDGARLEVMTRTELVDVPKDNNRTGLAHLAFSVGSKEEVDALTLKLKTDGYQVISGPRTTGDGYYESCVLDDEGNQIEITV